jgi:hypothetical protein
MLQSHKILIRDMLATVIDCSGELRVSPAYDTGQFFNHVRDGVA